MKLKLITEANQNELMEITTQWMAEKYNEMNQQLFNGELGGCDFSIFKTGKGSRGNVLGWFKMCGSGIKYNRSDRRLYYYNPYYVQPKTYINRNNFVELCKPRIELNGNYRWTEKAALSTLVHEMCHYYNVMYGYEPTRAHGREFKEIAAYVSSKSNCIFTVQRLASAEQMNEMDFTDSMKDFNNKRASRGVHVFKMVLAEKRKGYYFAYAIPTSTNYNDYLWWLKHSGKKYFKKAYDCFTYDGNVKRYKTVSSISWYYRNSFEDITPDVKYESETLILDEEPTQMPTIPDVIDKSMQAPIIKHFRIQLSQGGVFEVSNVTEEQLKEKLRERFPRWSEQVVEKIASDTKYRV